MSGALIPSSPPGLARWSMLICGPRGLPKGDANDTASCVDALLREIHEEPNDDLRDLFESIALGTIVNTMGVASLLPNWVQLLRRFRALLETEPQLADLKKGSEKAARELGQTYYGAIFSVGTRWFRYWRIGWWRNGEGVSLVRLSD